MNFDDTVKTIFDCRAIHAQKTTLIETILQMDDLTLSALAEKNGDTTLKSLLDCHCLAKMKRIAAVSNISILDEATLTFSDFTDMLKGHTHANIRNPHRRAGLRRR